MPEAEIVFSVKESPEGGFETRAVGLSIFVRAATFDELKVNVRKAARCYFGDGTNQPLFHFDEVWANVRVLGSAKGEFTVPDDFNDPLPKEIEDLFW